MKTNFTKTLLFSSQVFRYNKKRSNDNVPGRPSLFD